MNLRVLHILDHSIPLQSGYTFRTAAILREQRALGWETFQLTSPKQGGCNVDEEDVEGLHFYRTRMPVENGPRIAGLFEFRLMAATTKRLEEIARRVGPEILHAHSPVLNGIPALRVGRKLGIPVVYEVRALWEDAAVDHGTHTEWGPRYRLVRGLETRVLKRVDHITTICEGLRTDILARGIPSEKVTVIPNAVDITEFQAGGIADEALKTTLGLTGKTVVGFLGSFYAYEGLDLLLDALPLILKEMPDARVLLVGGGPQEAALKEQASHLALTDKVVFTGRVPHTEVGRYYDLFDILAYPRHSLRVTELVTPLKPLEAMAQGKLLVASDVGGHRELIDDGRTGVLFKADDVPSLASAVVDLIRDRDRWPSLRTAGRRFVETERNWGASVARYRPVFERLALPTP